MKALILAAGFGSRLAPLTDECPKSLIKVNGMPILIRQIENLRENGITDITVVSGYRAADIKNMIEKRYPNIRIIESRDYAETNNMYSAYLARDVMEEEAFLMMNADVFFDASVISALLEDCSPNAVVTDIGRYLAESMKVTQKNGKLTSISKQITEEDALGSSIDVYKFSPEGGKIFFQKCAEYIEKKGERKLWSEVALNDAFQDVEFHACPLKGRWLEIDDMNDLRAAENLFAIESDHFGKPVEILRKKKLFLLDMDGTIYQEDHLFEGSYRLLDAIRENGGRYVFVTNNSSKSVMDYVEKLRHMGIEAEKEDFYTSSQATARYLKKYYPGVHVYCQGTASLVAELREMGIDVTQEADPDIGLILVGFDTEMTSAKLRVTCELLKRDIPFVATNPDLVCPVSFGYVPDCGSICQMLKNATGKSPVFIGKPETAMIDTVMEKYGNTKEQTVVIGDRLYTDIAAGLNAGVTSVCVLTGEAREKDIVEGNVKPTLTFNTVGEIACILAANGKRG